MLDVVFVVVVVVVVGVVVVCGDASELCVVWCVCVCCEASVVCCSRLLVVVGFLWRGCIRLSRGAWRL